MISTASAKAFLSALKRSATWAGVVPPGTMPLWTSFSRTDGVFTASIGHNNVVELVFSDAAHQHYSQPEIVLGHYTP